jgi:CheY-like chemotaxis protein
MIGAHAPAATRNDPSPNPLRFVNGRRLLVVEDEPLIAMTMKETLTELDFEVSGPVGSVEEALREIAKGPINAAILDINLGGGSVYPVADALAARDIPFVFVTGYARQAVEQRFSDVPVLSKPVDRERLLASLSRPPLGQARPMTPEA